MTEVVLDVKLASLGVLNITPRGLTDYCLIFNKNPRFIKPTILAAL